MVVHTFTQKTPITIVHRVQVGVYRWPHIEKKKLEGLAMEKLGLLCQYTVPLKQVDLACEVTDCWQHF